MGYTLSENVWLGGYKTPALRIYNQGVTLMLI